MAASTSDIVCVGSCNHDLIAYMHHLPAPGQTIMGSSFQMGFGGKGANQCVAAARLAGRQGSVAMVSALGDDVFGASTLANFDAVGVQRDAVRTHAGAASGVAPIWVDGKGQNCIVVVPGANLLITPADVTQALSAPHCGSCRAMLCQLEITTEATLTALRTGRQRGMLTVFSPAPAPPEPLHDDFFSCTSILIPNEGEARALAGPGVGGGIIGVARSLLSRGCKAVVVTLGGRGGLVVAAGAEHGYFVPAVAVARVVDTTGAGDAFAGSLAFFYTMLAGSGGDGAVQLPVLLEAVCRATVVAADTVTKPGTQRSYPARGDLPSPLFDAAMPRTPELHGVPTAVAVDAAVAAMLDTKHEL